MEDQTLPYGLGALWPGREPIQLEGHLRLCVAGRRRLGSTTRHLLVQGFDGSRILMNGTPCLPATRAWVAMPKPATRLP